MEGRARGVVESLSHDLFSREGREGGPLLRRQRPGESRRGPAAAARAGGAYHRGQRAHTQARRLRGGAGTPGLVLGALRAAVRDHTPRPRSRREQALRSRGAHTGRPIAPRGGSTLDPVPRAAAVGLRGRGVVLRGIGGAAEGDEAVRTSRRTPTPYPRISRESSLVR